MSLRIRAPRMGALAVAALITAPSAAHVFECHGDGAPVFQATPCDAHGRAIEIRPHQPGSAEREAARRSARKEARFVQQVETEREIARREAARERQRREAERALKAERCARYLTEAERAEENASAHHRRNRHKHNHERRARDLRDRHFSECFAAD